MRTYTIDELSEEEIRSVASRLEDMSLAAGVEGVYWLPVPVAQLSPLQREHQAECGPYVLSLLLEANSIHLELLVRGRGRLRCQCLSFASPALRDHMISYLEELLRKLGLSF